MSHQPPIEKPGQSGRPLWIRMGLLATLILGGGFSYWMWADHLSLSNLAQQESQLRQFQVEHPWLVYGMAFVIYVAVTGLSLPGAAALTLLAGWYFGVLPGVLLVSFASTTGATLAFLLSRFLFRDAVQARFGGQLAAFNQSLQREGAFYLFTLRLIPAIPFFVINAVMGLTPIRLRTFWWVSQLGMLAGTVVYVYAGSVVPDLQTLAEKGVAAVFTSGQLVQILVAFSLLGLFPWIARGVIHFTTARKPQLSEKSTSPDRLQSSTGPGKTGNEP